jgi:hypothetical protein
LYPQSKKVRRISAKPHPMRDSLIILNMDFYRFPWLAAFIATIIKAQRVELNAIASVKSD